jgi:hypothetical protein
VWLCALCASLFFASSGFAQALEVREMPPGPGTVLKFEVRLSGPDSEKVRRISLYFAAAIPVPLDQPGFVNAFSGAEVQPDAPDTFHPQVTVPANVTTGDYILYVNLQFDPGTVQYSAGKQFQLAPIHITNDKRVKLPGITVIPSH